MSLRRSRRQHPEHIVDEVEWQYSSQLAYGMENVVRIHGGYCMEGHYVQEEPVGWPVVKLNMCNKNELQPTKSYILKFVITNLMPTNTTYNVQVV